MLHWHEKFKTGIKQIDSQHQILIRHINDLEVMLKHTNPSRDEVEFCIQLINFMEKYTKLYCADEERPARSTASPAKRKPKAGCEEFRQFFENFKARFDQYGCRPEILKQLHHECKAWIQEHVLRVDPQPRSRSEQASRASAQT